MTAQGIRLASMRTFMTDANPEFRLGIQELAALRTELSRAEQSSPAKVAGNGAECIAKSRDFMYYKTLFELMAKQYELARLDEARDGVVIQVLDAAKPPERKSRPARALIAVVTTLAAFFLTLIAVFIRQALRNMAGQPDSADKLARLRRLIWPRRAKRHLPRRWLPNG